MEKNLRLFMAKNEYDIVTFWNMFDNYINELSLNASFGDEFDLEYFYSDEYRNAIDELRTRETNPLRIFFITKDEIIIGFLMYATYFDEDGKCFLMEYCIEPEYRKLGYGKLAYLMVQKHIKDEGASYIELTPTNESNERFWSSVGFRKSTDMDEDNKCYYRKSL